MTGSAPDSPVFVRIATGLRYDKQTALQGEIRAALAGLDARGAGISADARVALKINLAVPAPPEAAVGTHPELLRAAIVVLQERGVEIVVVEDCDEAALSLSGVGDVLGETRVSFLNLRERPYRAVIRGGYTYHYAQDVLEADHLISLPKLKTHLYTQYTGAIKNMYGCLAKAQRRELHREMATQRFAEHLVHVYAVRPPDLVIMDAIVGMEGIGPTQGRPREAGWLLIGNDGVLLDRVAVGLVGYDPGQIDVLRLAMERGLARCAPEEVAFTGRRPVDVPGQGWSRLPVLAGERRTRTLLALCGPLRAEPEACRRCGACAESCPFGAIRLAPYPEVDDARCRFCFCCLELCPHGAIMPAKFQGARSSARRFFACGYSEHRGPPE